MPGPKEHSYITRNAVMLAGNNFPEALCQDYCSYPDIYFVTPEKVKKYQFETDGIQFHYPPVIDYAPLYRYWQVKKDGRLARKPYRNDNFRHMLRGFDYYIRHTLRETEAECWKYAGCLIHTLEDSLIGVHTLENARGVDIHALERLGYFRRGPADILGEYGKATGFPEITGYRPCVLGRNAEEMALNLYSRYVFLGDSSRAASFQAIMAIQEKDDVKAALRAIEICFRNAVMLVADTLYTLQLLRKKKAAAEFVPLHSLTEVMPFRFPFGGGGGAYVFSPYTTGEALNKQRKKIPLSLRIAGKKKDFAEGFAFGIHQEGALLFRLPRSGYTGFTATVGLHPECDANPKLQVEWLNAGKTVMTMPEIDRENAQTIRLNAPRGIFGVRIHSDSTAGVLVIAEPRLLS